MKISLSLAILTGVILTGAVICPRRASAQEAFSYQNLVKNGSFEKGSGDWFVDPSSTPYQIIDFNQYSRRLASKIVLADYLPSHQNRYLELKSEINSQKAAFKQKVSGLKPGAEYLLVVDARVTVGKNFPVVEIHDSQGEERLLTEWVPRDMAQTGWTRFGGGFEAKSSEATISLYAFNSQPGETGRPGIYNYDNVWLIEIPGDKRSDFVVNLGKKIKTTVSENDLKVAPYRLDYQSLFPPGFESALDGECQRLGVPVYDLFFEEEKFWDRPLEELKAEGEENMFPAEFKYLNQTYEVKIRLRGVVGYHFDTPTKSFRVKFSDDDYFFGKNSINLIRPVNRGYLIGHYNYYLAEKLGLISLDNQFVFLRINGKPYGLMYELEHWRKEILEKNQRPEGDLYGDNLGLSLVLKDPDKWKKYVRDPYTKKNDQTNISLLIDFMNNNLMEEFKSLVNVDKFIRWNVHAILIGSGHQYDFDNNRLYFDSTQGRFELIPWDAQGRTGTIVFSNPLSDADEPREIRWNHLIDYLLKDLEVFNQRNRFLWEYLNDLDNPDADVAYFNQAYSKIRPALAVTRHYELFEGLYLVPFNEVEGLLSGVGDQIRKHYQKVKDLFGKNSRGITVGLVEEGPVKLNKDNYYLIKVEATLKDNQELSATRISEIDVDQRLARGGLVLFEDNGDGAFSEKSDERIFGREAGVGQNALVKTGALLPSKFYHEVYRNIVPIVLPEVFFDQALKSMKINRREKQLLKDNYGFEKEKERYVLNEFENVERERDSGLIGVFKKLAVIPEYDNRKVFWILVKDLKGAGDLSRLVGLKAVNATTDELLPVEIKKAPESSPKRSDVSPVGASLLSIDDLLNETKIKTSLWFNKFKISQDEKEIDKAPFLTFSQISDSPDSFSKRHSIFVRDAHDLAQFRLPAGSYRIDRTIIVPQKVKLSIEPGTTLKFKSNTSLIVYGEVTAKGTKAEPIVFKPAGLGSWGVLGLVGKQARGEFENCLFEKGSEAYLNGVYFSGMLSGYHAQVKVKNCRFQFASRQKGDDAVNFKYGRSTIENSFFYRNDKDAVDFDFMEKGSLISDSHFLENGNDGIDLSGSESLIFNNLIENSADKGISLGEESQDTVFNNLIVNGHIGVAVKDLAEPGLVNNTIVGNDLGIAVYQKKEIFGGGLPLVVNTFLENDKMDFAVERFDRGNLDAVGAESVCRVSHSRFVLKPELIEEMISEPEQIRAQGKRKRYEEILEGKDDRSAKTSPQLAVLRGDNIVDLGDNLKEALVFDDPELGDDQASDRLGQSGEVKIVAGLIKEYGLSDYFSEGNSVPVGVLKMPQRKENLILEQNGFFFNSLKDRLKRLVDGLI